jgi:predicted MFS family arabinose efflux permease
MGSSPRGKFRFLFIAISILVFGQTLIAALTVNSLEKVYLETFVSNINIFENYFKQKVENALRFGKPLDKFLGIETLMAEFQDLHPEIHNIVIFDADGKVLYHLADFGHASAPPAFRLDFGDGDETEPGFRRASDGDQYHVLNPIRGPGGVQVGTLSFGFLKERISSRNRELWYWSARVAGSITLAASGILLLLLHRFVPFSARTGPPRRRLFYIIFLVVGLAQIGYSVVNAKTFRDNYIEVTRTVVTSLGEQFRSEIEGMLRKNLQLRRLRNIDVFFGEAIRALPEIEAIHILDAEGRRLSLAENGEDASLPDIPPRFTVSTPLVRESRDGMAERQGFVRIDLSEATIQAMVREILLDSLTVTLISLLFSVELIIFLSIILDRSLREAAEAAGEVVERKFSGTLARPAAFSFLFMYALPISFIPLQMKNLYVPIGNLSPDVVLGLPISVEMFCSLVTALLAGVLVDKRGWHLPFLGGIALVVAGSFLSGNTESGIAFIFYRGLTGLGYGLAWMSIQGFVLKYAAPEARARGIANLVAGIIAGHICGTAMGALVAERLGYRSVFLLSAGLGVVPVAFVLFFMREHLRRPEAVAGRKPVRPGDFIRFVTDRNIFAVLFFVIVPYSLAQIGLLLFATPIYLSDQGASQSNIGRVMMIYGLSFVYLSPFVARFVDRAEDKRIFIASGGLVAGVGLILLHYHQGFLAILVAVFMLGIASSLGNAAQSAFILKFDVTERLGSGTASSIQRAADKLGQMLGPLVLGVFVARMGIENGIVAAGVILLVASLLFIVTVKE